VERTPVEWEGEEIRVTISVGLAHNHSGAAVSDPQRLVAAADKALYAAKDNGRNRIEVARSPGRYAGVDPEVMVVAQPPEIKSRERVWEVNTSPQDETRKPVRLAPDLRNPGKPNKS